MEELLKQILGRLDKIESNVDKLAIELALVHDRVRAQESRLVALCHRIDAVDLRIEGFERRVTNKIENMESDFHLRFTKIEKAVGAHDAQLKAIAPPRRSRKK